MGPGGAGGIDRRGRARFRLKRDERTCGRAPRLFRRSAGRSIGRLALRFLDQAAEAGEEGAVRRRGVLRSGSAGRRGRCEEQGRGSGKRQQRQEAPAKATEVLSRAQPGTPLSCLLDGPPRPAWQGLSWRPAAAAPHSQGPWTPTPGPCPQGGNPVGASEDVGASCTGCTRRLRSEPRWSPLPLARRGRGWGRRWGAVGVLLGGCMACAFHAQAAALTVSLPLDLW
jgi:hypothetical protein